MRDPSRWLSPEGGAPPGARELLRHGSAPRALDAASRAKHAAMMSKIAAGAVGTAATSTVTSGIKFSLSTKLLAGVGILATATAIPVMRERARREHAAIAHSPVAHPQLTHAPQARIAPRIAAPPAPFPEATPLAHAPTPEALPDFEATTAPEQNTIAPVSTALPSRHTIAAPTVARRVVIPVASPTPTIEAPVAAPPIAPETAPTADVLAATAQGAGLGSAQPPPPRSASEGEQMLDVLPLVGANPALALSEINRLAREFPNSRQSEEREYLAVRALHNLHRDAEARTRAQALIAQNPRTSYATTARRMFNLP